MRMKFAYTLRRLAFAPLPAPPGFFALPLRLIVGYGFLEHGYAKLARGRLHWHPARDWHAILVLSRLGDDSHRGDRRTAYPLRGFCASRLGAHDRRAARCNFHRPPAQRIQLDQARRLRRVGRAFWTARLRDRPALSRRSARALLRRRRAVLARWLCERTPERCCSMQPQAFTGLPRQIKVERPIAKRRSV